MDACALYLLESTIDSSVIERFNHRKTQIKFMKDLLLPRLWVLKIFEMKFVITSVWDFSSDFLKIDRFSDGFYRPESGLGSLRLFGHNRNSGLLQNAFRRWPTGVLRFLCCHAEFAYEINSCDRISTAPESFPSVTDCPHSIGAGFPSIMLEVLTIALIPNSFLVVLWSVQNVLCGQHASCKSFWWNKTTCLQS